MFVTFLNEKANLADSTSWNTGETGELECTIKCFEKWMVSKLLDCNEELGSGNLSQGGWLCGKATAL